jgi:uncharacterized protein DUF3306
MTEEDFLKRWSRRKREVAEAEKPAPAEAETREQAPLPERAAPGDPAKKSEGEFDPASLPPVESITAVSDITAFLRAGVPEELTRAALRRVWTADPAIRDFVGLAENAWDFTDPNAMPGFGPLESTDEVRRMIAQIVDSIGEAVKPPASEVQPDIVDVSQNLNDSNVLSSSSDEERTPRQVVSAQDQADGDPAEILGNQVLLRSNKEDVAMQRDATEGPEKSKQLSQRQHGSALPR